MQSYSQSVKDQLGVVTVTKKCCRFTDEKMRSLEKNDDNGDILAEIYSKCRCDGCRTVFLRRAFMLYGSVTDPDKAYHLDFSFKVNGEANAVESALSDCGFDFRRTVRKDRHVLYVKNSTSIEDFLVSIGASGSAFDLMNSKIVREFRNSVNRQVNCDTANIEKQIDSAKKYVDAVNFLEKTGKIDSLSPELKETARLRAENDQASLSDLSNMLNPPVTKSGMRHRLEKIYETAVKFGMKNSEI